MIYTVSKLNTKLTSVSQPTVVTYAKGQLLITRNDISENLPNHFVDVYLNDAYYKTVQDGILDLTWVENSLEGSLIVKLIAWRNVYTYKLYATPVIIKASIVASEYTLCSDNLICSATDLFNSEE